MTEPGRMIHDEKTSILLVDDHPENILALRAILDRPDYNLIAARSGPEALKLLLRHDVALILLDVMMPGMDGYEVANLIKQRETNRYTPIIFMTAVAKEVEHLFKGYSVGAVDYLLKPLAAEIVRTKVAVFVDLHKKSRQIQEFRIREVMLSEEKRFRTLADSIPQIVWTSRPDGMVVYCNQRWFDYTGLTFEQTRRFGWNQAIHPEDRNRIVSAWGQALTAGTTLETEVRLLGVENAAYRWYLIRAVPSRNAKNEIVEWFGTCTDIEDQKRLVAELENTIRARDEFFSIASHELKTPTTSLKLQLELLERKIRKERKESVPVTELLEKLIRSVRQTDRLAGLIENLLDVSRIRSKNLGLERENIDLSALVTETISRFLEQARVAGSTIVSHIPRQVINGELDRIRIEQVLTNLLSNAVKYGSGKGIEVSLSADENTATLTVQDHGIGISKEDQERIFGRFERAVTLKDFSGLGLGLYITQQIVQAHGGKIDVESTPGQGSKFTIRLPRRPVSMEKAA